MAFPVEEKYILNTEKELCVRFPDSFRKRMMESNGEGVEVKQDYFELHPFYDFSNKKRIKRTCNSTLHETKTARERYNLPENLIVIGNNGGGDILVYKLENDGSINNTVYWQNHETGELNFAANDFADLNQSV